MYLSKHTDLLPSRPVSSDGRRMDFDRESASRSNEKSDEYYTRNLQALRITLRALHTAYRCCSESISRIYKWRKQWHNVIGSLVYLYNWSIRACKRVSDGLTRFSDVISGRSNSARRSLARVTGFCARILNAVNAILDNVIHSISYKMYMVL